LRGRVAIPWDDIPGVKGMLDDGKTVAEIADFFGVSRRTIYRVIKLNNPVRQAQKEE
jgi:DNA invertase Pin-like site-specific DNA recombinase